jgi:hypothetical protein
VSACKISVLIATQCLCGNVVDALRSTLGEIEVSDFRNWVVGCDAAPGVLV